MNLLTARQMLANMEVETPAARLAQLARAVGIHLIIILMVMIIKRYYWNYKS